MKREIAQFGRIYTLMIVFEVVQLSFGAITFGVQSLK